ncbi:MAG: DUF3048 domain-containing protein [Acidimicrobiia bacterium]
MHRHPTIRPFRGPVIGLVAFALVAAACSGSDESTASTSFSTIAPTTSTSSTTTTSTSTTVERTTTTVEATTTTVPGPPVYPLTGILVADPAIAARPALVVKIDNASAARPQTGFNAADLVFEEIVNDNLTRFAMVFQSGGSDPVGPIRSGRIQDIDLFGSFNHPLFAWSGGNATVTAAIRASDLVELGPSVARVYFRTSDRKVPHNLYSNTTALWGFTPYLAGPPPQQFRYRSDGEPAAGVAALGVGVALDSINAEWEWDPASSLYMRTMEGRPHNDAAGGRVSANNVVVLVMEYLPGISGSPDAQTLGTGEAFVFTAGNYIHGTWTRNDRLQPFTLTADDGSPIELTPGRTFIELPRNGSTLPFPA